MAANGRFVEEGNPGWISGGSGAAPSASPRPGFSIIASPADAGPN